MILGTEKELLRLLSTFALFYLGFSLNCSHTIDTGRWSVDVVCTDVTQEIPGNKYECLMRANPNYLKGGVKGDVWVGGVTGTLFSRMVKLKCSTRFNLPNSTDAYTYTVFFGSVWSPGKRIIELKLEDPGKPTVRDCPTYVREGDHVMCQCSPEHHGFPPPILLWSRQTNSSILELNDISLEHNMTKYKCEMTWGMKVKTVFYTLMITHRERTFMDTTPRSISS